MLWNMFGYWLLLVCCICGVMPDDEELKEVDTSAWVDPGDMLNFNPGPKNPNEVESQPSGSSKEKEPPSVASALPDLLKTAGDVVSSVGLESGISCPWDSKKELDLVRLNLSRLQTQYDKCRKELGSSRNTAHMPYFKQYVRTLLGFFHDEVDAGGSITYNIEVELSAHDREVMQRFVDTEDGSVQDAHAVLSHMIKRVQLTRGLTQEKLSMEKVLGIDLTTLIQVLCIVTLVPVAIKLYSSLNMSLLQIFLRILLLLFIVSVPWNWWHMYKVAVAKRQAAALKAVPTECRSGLQGAAQSLFGYLKSTFSFQQDECAKYQETMVVDPMWEVAPTQAIAVTLTKFFVEPAEHIGSGLGKLIKGTLQDLPIQLWPIALALLVVLILIILIMSCGYRIRFFYLFGLEPDSKKRLADREKDINNKLEGITSKMEELMSSHTQMQKDVNRCLPNVTELRPAIASYAANESPKKKHELLHSVSQPFVEDEDDIDGPVVGLHEVHSAPVITLTDQDLFQEKQTVDEKGSRMESVPKHARFVDDSETVDKNVESGQSVGENSNGFEIISTDANTSRGDHVEDL